jgi:DNA-directed RNA polymerase subunit RPC12/RpoP
MSLGTILVSLAVVVGVGAYVAWPFRRTDALGAEADLDRMVEAWVRRVQTEAARTEVVGNKAEAMPDSMAQPVESVSARAPGGSAVSAAVTTDTDTDEPANFCPYCGRRVEPDHMFCPRCGRQLMKQEVR